jgi:hypothetical protein
MNGLSRSTGSGLAISGAIVALIGNLLAPRFDEDTQSEVYRAVAASDRLVPSFLILILAFLLTTAGVVAIAASMRGGAGNDAAWLGSAAVAAGGAIAIAQLAIATFGYRQLAEIYVGADNENQEGAFWATSAADHVNTSLFSAWTILFLGLGPILIGIAMAQSRAFPTWLAGIGVVGGVICLFVGVSNLVREDQSALDLVFLIGSLLVTAWLLAAGVLLRREPADVTAQPA